MPVPLHYKIYGDGMPVIILHGLFGMLDNWHTFSRKLSETYKVYAVDIRDHGNSTHTEVFNYQEIAKDILYFMNQENIDNSRLIGHSMGGKATMQLMNDYPEKVSQAVIIDIAPVKYTGNHSFIFEALNSIDLEAVGSRKELELSLEPQIKDKGTLLFLLKNLKRSRDGRYSWKMNLKLLENEYANIMDSSALNQSISTPCLFVKGSKSNYITKENYAQIKMQFLNSKLITIQDAGHWIHAEKPIELLNVIQNYFSKL